MKGKKMGKPLDDKPKNFKSSILSLFRYLKPWYAAIVISLLLSLASTVLTLIAPDKMALQTPLPPVCLPALIWTV